MPPLKSIRLLLFSITALLLGGVVLAGWTLRTALAVEETSAPAVSVESVPPPSRFELPEQDFWSGPVRGGWESELTRWQLAGTFQTYDEAGREDSEPLPTHALALVEDLQEGRQRLVGIGDFLGEFEVGEIGVDRIRLRRGGRGWELSLTGVIATLGAPLPSVESAETAGPRIEDLPALETSRFGKRISENQWVIERQEVFRYAEEIMGNPLRATRLFHSFSQVAAADAGPESDDSGFRLGMKGEQDFFRDLGLRDGDIIRKVNSMNMRNQTRAEYLVREFMRSRMSAVVLDVEREGATSQQIYIIR
jgi:hypothetical protein